MRDMPKDIIATQMAAFWPGFECETTGRRLQPIGAGHGIALLLVGLTEPRVSKTAYAFRGA